MMLALKITKVAIITTVVKFETTLSRHKKNVDKEFMHSVIAKKIKNQKILSNNSFELLVAIINRLYYVSAKNPASRLKT